jgi:hypothetical protein
MLRFCAGRVAAFKGAARPKSPVGEVLRKDVRAKLVSEATT